MLINYALQYTAAAKQQQLDGTARAMASLAQVLKNEPKLQGLIGAPTLTQSDKSQIVAELEKHTGGADKSGTVKNFLSTLAVNNRLGLLDSVCEKFAELMSAGKGEIELRITSAQVRSPVPYNTICTEEILTSRQSGTRQQDPQAHRDRHRQVRVQPRQEAQGHPQNRLLHSRRPRR